MYVHARMCVCVCVSRAVSRGPANRKLFEGEKQGNPDDWKCDIASYFFTNRNVQPLNGRPVYVVN